MNPSVCILTMALVLWILFDFILYGNLMYILIFSARLLLELA